MVLKITRITLRNITETNVNIMFGFSHTDADEGQHCRIGAALDIENNM